MKMPKEGKGALVAKKSKRKRWKKGQSSSSNPDHKKYRQAAKSRFFNQNTGQGGLTQEALAKHDAAHNDMDGDTAMSEADGQSVGGRTFSTWASNWTECTNATFNRVHRYWASNSALHKEILAVLAAITEVIKSKGGQETETEYFAALMTAADTVDKEESLAAVAYLLSLAVKRVPPSVLKSRFSDISKTLLDLLASHANSETPALLRSLLMCLALVLRVQEQAAWTDAYTLQVYHGLLAFVTHPKPKVRKAAHHSVCVVLRGSTFMTQGDPPPHHPAASATAKYCIQQIEESGGGEGSTATLHILGLLKDILGLFPQHSLKATCETVLRVMTLSNVMVKSVAMQALHGMFSQKPKPNCLSAELNAQIITALYDYAPGESDVQQMAAWLAVMEKAHINLSKLDDKLCTSHLPRLFSAAMKTMLSEKMEVSQAAAAVLKTLISECLSPISESLGQLVQRAPTNASTPVHKMFSAVETGLSYQYHAAWGLVLQVLTTFFQVLGKQCPTIMKKCLKSMAGLRDSHQFSFIREVDHAVGVAVQKMGPRTVLETIPLQITGDEDNYEFPHSWLLPVLRDNIQETELAFFTSYFLPLAAKLRTKCLEYSKINRVVESKTYDALQSQMWSLLPGFCKKPTDLQQSFRGIAKILGSAISDRPDLRMEVMASIRKLITQNLDNEANRAELARFSKNFLPILFNIFTSEPENEKDSSRLAVLETVKCYLQITEPKLVQSFFDKICEKIQEGDVSAFRRHALMDLCTAMVPYLDSKRLKILYTLATSNLESMDKTMQKKSYRALEDICAGKSDDSKCFVTSHLKQLQSDLLNSLSTSSPSSKAPRLRCLANIFRQLDVSQEDFMHAVIPEAILCTKEVGERACTAAYNLLVQIGDACIRWSESADSDTISLYLEHVMAGLAGSPHMISATTLALTRLLYEYKAKVSSELLGTVIRNACLLLKSKAREVVQSTLGLVKVVLSIFADTTLAQFLSEMVSSLVSMKEDCKHHFRFKAKEIFTRLVRKFGYQTIQSMVPDSHQKMLTNIRKDQERKKKKRKEKTSTREDGEGEDGFSTKAQPQSIEDLLRDTDSELEEDEKKTEKVREKKSKKPSQGAAWLQESTEEDIIDFMDASVSKKVLGTKPEEVSKKKTDHGFKTSSDGRLIITEGEEEKAPKKGKPAIPDVDDLDELMEAMDHYSKRSRKRKHSATEDVGDSASVMTYKSGGTGIHRNLDDAKKRRSDADSDFGGAYKAKKAGGDIKKTGKPDPYAYVPLDMKFLNKRKKAKMAGRFKNLVKGAKRGAESGQKSRGKRK